MHGHTTHISIHSLDKYDRDVFCHHLVIYWSLLQMETREILPSSTPPTIILLPEDSQCAIISHSFILIYEQHYWKDKAK